MNQEKLELVADFYEFTMSNGYFSKNKNDIAYFDVFFRKVPDGGGYAIVAGLEQIIEFIQNLKFDEEDIEYLRKQNIFSEEYLNYLKDFKFTGDIWAIPEGTVVFPNEPLITVRAPVSEAQLLETMLLLIINHQSLIATKTARIVRAAQGRPVMEFGARRAHGVSAAIYGARAAIIGGAVGTSCTAASEKFHVPASGTMAHSWIQSFDSEYEAFKAYAESFPDNCTLLVDTYNTLESGMVNAIKAYNDILKPMGKKLAGIRIDSGDLAYLSKQARQMLDNAGLVDTKIIVSNSLDEYLISSLLKQNAPIDSFGVGENMITAKSNPVFGGVYKLVAIEKGGEIIPKIKLSNNVEKMTNPHFKNIYRLLDKNGKIIADLLTIYNENKPSGKIILFHPQNNWTQKTVENYTVRNLRLKIIENGKIIHKFKTVEETRKYVQEELSTLWEEALRLENPHTYVVNLSDELFEIKNKLINSYKNI